MIFFIKIIKDNNIPWKNVNIILKYLEGYPTLFLENMKIEIICDHLLNIDNNKIKKNHIHASSSSCNIILIQTIIKFMSQHT